MNRIKKNILVLIPLLSATFFCNAQKDISHTNQQWLQYFNQLKLSSKLTLFSDMSLRKIDNFSTRSQITFRTGLGYTITKNLQGVTGIGFFATYNKNNISRIEYRPYQEVSTSQLFGKVSVQHRLRIEARYFRLVSDVSAIDSTSSFNFRFRYRLLCSIPVSKLSVDKPDRNLSLNIGDEIFINAGKEIVYNVFDNNRFILGTTFQYNNKLSFTFSYINQFRQLPIPQKYEQSNIFTLGLTQKLSLLKSKKATQ